MSDASKRERVEELLRKSLLGEELVDTQFHLFSARSLASGRVLKPRVLCANDVLLAKSSTYFSELLSSDVHRSDPSLIGLTDNRDVPDGAQIGDYGYGSDSDLEECNDPVPVAILKKRKGRSGTKDDEELSDDGSESVSSDMFVMSPEQPRGGDLFPGSKDGVGSVASTETAVQETTGDKPSESANQQTAVRLRSLASRHVLVKDTAFQTWYTLLNYLYTDKFSFMPLSSTTAAGRLHASSTSSLDAPRCSAKSMYRLASKVGLDSLRDEAFAYIRRNLTEHNILTELACSLLSTHPELLEMELDVLYNHIASPPVVAAFPALARRIADKEIAHGAKIVVGVHTRLLKVVRPCPLERVGPEPLPAVSGNPARAVGVAAVLGPRPNPSSGDVPKAVSKKEEADAALVGQSEDEVGSEPEVSRPNIQNLWGSKSARSTSKAPSSGDEPKAVSKREEFGAAPAVKSGNKAGSEPKVPSANIHNLWGSDGTWSTAKPPSSGDAPKAESKKEKAGAAPAVKSGSKAGSEPKVPSANIHNLWGSDGTWSTSKPPSSGDVSKAESKKEEAGAAPAVKSGSGAGAKVPQVNVFGGSTVPLSRSATKPSSSAGVTKGASVASCFADPVPAPKPTSPFGFGKSPSS